MVSTPSLHRSSSLLSRLRIVLSIHEDLVKGQNYLEEKRVREVQYNYLFDMLCNRNLIGTYNLYNTPGIPHSAVSFSGGICATEQEGSGFLTMWPASAPMPEGNGGLILFAVHNLTSFLFFLSASVLNYQLGVWIIASTYSSVSLTGEFRM